MKEETFNIEKPFSFFENALMSALKICVALRQTQTFPVKYVAQALLEITNPSPRH